MNDWVRVGLRLPKEINKALKIAAADEYMTKNQKAVEIFKAWLNVRAHNKAAPEGGGEEASA
jgi:hypothetical protein